MARSTGMPSGRPVRGQAGEIMRWIGTADDLDGLEPQDEAARVERQASELRDLLGAVQPVDGERFAFVDSSGRALTASTAYSRSTTVRPPCHTLPGQRATRGQLVRSTDSHLGAGRVAAGGRWLHHFELAKLLGSSLRSVESSRARLRRTLGVRTRAELVRYALDTLADRPADLILAAFTNNRLTERGRVQSNAHLSAQQG